MQSASIVCDVPFGQIPRAGQRRVFEALVDHDKYLNIQLPTGYGKTFTALGCYSIKQHRGEANRLLVIFPSDQQLAMFEADSRGDSTDFLKTGVEGPQKVMDIRYFGSEALLAHKRNDAQIFVITVQSLIRSTGLNIVRDLMQTGRWMVVVDEYHHYGLEKAWGQVARSLPAVFLLAMSATPARSQNDSAFGPPHVVVKYRAAVEEETVKPLIGHAYNYRIQTLQPDGSTRTFTTAEIAQEAGSDSPDAIERWRVERKMRWSPQYVSPLVETPIERMIRTRISSGHPCLQVLIGAMCVSHAEQVCEHVRAMFPDLRVDWVGTGPNGRSDTDNAAVLARFVPPKDDHGRRSPTLDVLVHVGMAGEGLDSIYVVEVVHLNRANKNNSNDQENGRAARWLSDSRGEPIEGNISFDITSDYAKFTGDLMMDAMDGNEPTGTPATPEDDGNARDFEPLPEEPAIMIYNMELLNIDSGHPGVQRMAQVVAEMVRGYSRDDLHEASPRYDALVTDAQRLYRDMRRREADEENDKSRTMQWEGQVNNALNAVVHRVIRMVSVGGARPERKIAGELKWKINTRKKQALGAVSRDIEVCRRHYQWLRNLEQDLLTKGIPAWLSPAS